MSATTNRQSSSSTASMFEVQAPSDTRLQTSSPTKMSTDQWGAQVYNAIKSESGLILALVKAHSPAGLSDSEIVKRFYAKVLQYCSDKPYLWQCDPTSVMKAAVTATEQGLDINIPNEAHLVPYSGKATLQRGYKGLLKMARRDPNLGIIKAVPVYGEDTFKHTEGAETNIIHEIDYALDDRGTLRLFYALAKSRSGEVYAEVMTVKEILAHAQKYVKASKGPFGGLNVQGVTHPNFIPYGRKTVLLRLINRQLDIHSAYAGAVHDENMVERGDEGLVQIQVSPPSEEEAND